MMTSIGLIYKNAKVNSYIEHFTHVASSYANVLTKESVFTSKEFNSHCTDWFRDINMAVA